MIGLIPVCSDEQVKCKDQPYLGRIKDEYFVFYFFDKNNQFDSTTCHYREAVFFKDEEIYNSNELYEVAAII